MDDETLKLLTAILTGQQEFRAEFSQFRAEVNARFDRVEKRQEKLELRQENLEKLSAKFNQRFDTLGEQIVAIGLEVKSEVKDDVRFVLDKVDRMSIDVFTERAENARNRVDYFEVQKRLTKIEDAIRAV